MVMKKDHPNIKTLEMAIQKLGPLVDEMVFLGGCATCLLLTDPATPPPRVTYDVDVIVEAASLLDYHKLSEKLRRYLIWFCPTLDVLKIYKFRDIRSQKKCDDPFFIQTMLIKLSGCSDDIS